MVELESSKVLVLDTSAVININATGSAADILNALPNDVMVTQQVADELYEGSMQGHDDWSKLCTLQEDGIITTKDLVGKELAVFKSLIDGTACETIGDGEASSIAKATLSGGIVVLDDRKAIRIAQSRFSTLSTIPTIEILLNSRIEQELGRKKQGDAVYSALRKARMSLPPEYETPVLDLIGRERAATCPSLSRKARLALNPSNS